MRIEELIKAVLRVVERCDFANKLHTRKKKDKTKSFVIFEVIS